MTRSEEEGVCGAHPICESAHIHFDFEVKEEEVKSSWFYPEPMHSTAANLAHNDEDLTAPRLGPAAVAAQS